MSTPDKIKALFEDLGKPTLRGVRRCHKCGTYNGTRGISCKNKSCDVVFKEKEKKKGHSAEAVKIITGSTVQVFSIRLRDRGPDYRGFVQLPLVQDIDGNPAASVDPSVLASVARCYVESCGRTTLLGELVCPHIKAAIESTKEAQPLTLKNSVLNALQVSNEIKQAIWLLATETTGPLVQRVTKNIMVVKCKPNPKQPLGFLHFAFFETSRNRSQPEHKFHCTCKAFKQQASKVPVPVSKDDMSRRCVHFYACVCAFASDEKLMEEFSYYIELDSGAEPFLIEAIEDDGTEPSEQPLLTVYQTDDLEISTETTDPTALEVVISEDFLETPAKKRRKEEIVQASNALLTLQESNGNTSKEKKASPNRIGFPKPMVAQATRKPPNPHVPIDEVNIVSSFHSWLASVTERINQTMHYQFDGNPDPLVFHAPQAFFDCLQQRISMGTRNRKRVPNATIGFERKDALPLGTFTKDTWHITNVLHVKQIFDTPEITLEITRNFVENRDNTFDLYEIPKFDVENGDSKSLNRPIQPFELKTYLKVGNTTPDQKEPTPFIIEWIPDILPKTHIGEMRIKFEYGHQRNGHIEQRNIVTANELPLPVQTMQVHQENILSITTQ